MSGPEPLCARWGGCCQHDHELDPEATAGLRIALALAVAPDPITAHPMKGVCCTLCGAELVSTAAAGGDGGWHEASCPWRQARELHRQVLAR